MSNLGEFFKIVAEQEKRKKAEAEMLDALAQHLSRISENTKVVDKVEEVETELSELETDLIADLIEAAEEMLELEESKQVEELREVSLGPISGNTSTKTSDPLTPLDKRYATKGDLEQHYRTYITRIQQQLSTLGGGGETRLEFMDMATTLVTTSSYAVTHRDYYIGVNYSGAVTITLPVATKTGKTFVVKDESGEASRGTNRYITVLPAAGDLIDNKDRAILAYDWGSLTFVWRGDSWRVV